MVVGMSDPDSSPQRDLPASALLLAIAGSFLGVGTDSLMRGDIVRAIAPYVVGIAVFTIGVSWHWLKRIVGARLAATVNGVASDFRWWLAIFLVLFISMALPNGGIGTHFGRKNDDASLRWDRYLSLTAEKRLQSSCDESMPSKFGMLRVPVFSINNAEAISFAKQLDAALNDIPLSNRFDDKHYNVGILGKDDKSNDAIGLIMRSLRPNSPSYVEMTYLSCIRGAGIDIMVDPNPALDVGSQGYYILVGRKP
jgi:hypothetical protein